MAQNHLIATLDGFDPSIPWFICRMRLVPLNLAIVVTRVENILGHNVTERERDRGRKVGSYFSSSLVVQAVYH